MTISETKVFASPTASAFRKGAFTEEEMKIAVALNRAGVPYRTQVEFSTGRVNPRSHAGLIQTYTVDFKIGEHIVLEIIGEGTSSDIPARHDFFTKELGLEMMYATNKSVNASPTLVADWVWCHWVLSMMRGMTAK